MPTEPDTRNTSKLPRLLRFVRLGQELVAAPFSSRLAPLCCLPQDHLAISHPKAGSVSPKRVTRSAVCCALGRDAGGQEPGGGRTSVFSASLVSAADNSKDLATELVHYGFIHEVSWSLPPLLGCVCMALPGTVPKQQILSPNNQICTR